MSLLVANYGSSSEDEDTDNEEEKPSANPPPPRPSTNSAPLRQSPTATTASSASTNSGNNPTLNFEKETDAHLDKDDNAETGAISDSDDSFAGHISDEEDEAEVRSSSSAQKFASEFSSLEDSNVVGLSGVGLNLPKPRNATANPSPSSSTPPPLDPSSSSSSSSSLNLGSILPTPKGDSASAAPDEELEDFVRPRDWELEEAEKNESLKESVVSSGNAAKLSATKKKGGKVKISIPSLRDLGDDEEDQVPDAGLRNTDGEPKAKPGSGLFALLPKPKNISETKMEKRPLIPHVLTKKPPTTTTTTTTSKPVGGVKAQTGKRPAETATTERSESNFFSLGDDDASSRASIPSASSLSATKRLRVSHPDPEQYPLSFEGKNVSPSPVEPRQTASSPMSYAQVYNMAATDSQEASTLASSMSEEEAEKMNLAKLAGSQRVRGNELDGVDIVDVNADSALGGTNEIQENLLRELSAAGESGYRPQPKKGEGPSTVSKRKHQITYLAFQAKEREQLLKNQWAANAQTKRQTQAKYGF